MAELADAADLKNEDDPLKQRIYLCFQHRRVRGSAGSVGRKLQMPYSDLRTKTPAGRRHVAGFVFCYAPVSGVIRLRHRTSLHPPLLSAADSSS
jgi:hypothetical protein